MRFLRILRLRLVDARRVGQRVGAVKVRDHLADVLQRFVRETHRIRTHISDQADLAFAEVHAFVELLREPHRALRPKPSLRGSCCVDVVNGGAGLRRRCLRSMEATLSFPPPPFRSPRARARLRIVCDGELLDLVAPEFSQPRRKRLVRFLYIRVDGPVFPGFEARDLFLALADHAQGRAHAAR